MVKKVPLTAKNFNSSYVKNLSEADFVKAFPQFEPDELKKVYKEINPPKKEK